MTADKTFFDCKISCDPLLVAITEGLLQCYNLVMP